MTLGPIDGVDHAAGGTGTEHLPIVLLSTRNARESPAGLKLGVHDFFIESDAVRDDGYWNEYSGVMLATH